jgi:hypothetical protein
LFGKPETGLPGIGHRCKLPLSENKGPAVGGTGKGRSQPDNVKALPRSYKVIAFEDFHFKSIRYIINPFSTRITGFVLGVAG